MENVSRPMQDTLTALDSSFSDRLLHPQCVKERCCSPFFLLLADFTINTAATGAQTTKLTNSLQC